MNRRALLVVLTSCALAPACADTTDSPSSWELHDSTPQDHPPSTQPEVPSPSEVSSPAVPPLDLPEIAYPDDCDTPPPRHTTWTQTGQNTDSPLLTEVFGEQGCMMERFHYARDARERITREEYDVFEDSPTSPTYRPSHTRVRRRGAKALSRSIKS